VGGRLEDAAPGQREELVGLLKTKAIVQVYVLPYRQCVRAVRLFNLANELQAYVASLTGSVPKDNSAAEGLGAFAALPLRGAPSTRTANWRAALRVA